MNKILKFIYRKIPFKTNIFFILKKMGWMPSHESYQHLYFNGAFSVEIEQAKSFKMIHYGYSLENELFWGGLTSCRENISIAIWLELCREAECVFDIGANTGIYALLTKTVNPQAKVFAFEPISRICDKLKENNRINGFDIICIEKAVSNKDGAEIIYDLPTEHAYSASLNKYFISESNSFAVEIKTLKLDTFISENKINNVDLIKVDVETYEPEVFEGFKYFLYQFKPSILVEVLNNSVADRLNFLFEGTDYLYFNIDDTNKKIRQTDRVMKSDDFNYLICLESKMLMLRNNYFLSNIF